MPEFDTEVTEVIERAPGVKSFRFRAEERITFKPGQFFLVTIKVEGRDMAKHFSFSNSPTEKGYVEFTKRITGSPFSMALDSVRPGAGARIKMPYGLFTFEGEYDKAAFLSGGIGITPLRSMCRYASDMRLPADISLLYGNNRERDIIFRDDLDKMAFANRNLKIVYTLTSPDADEGWRGRRGYIDDKMIREEMPDYKERVFYICGPPKMVEGLTGILKNDLGVQDKNIRVENFTGY